MAKHNEITSQIRQSYDRIAGDYLRKRSDNYSGFWNLFLDTPAVLNLCSEWKTDSLVLDLGCACGKLSDELGKQGQRVVGIDFSEQLLRLADRRKGNYFVLGNAEKLPFASRSFDNAVSSLMLHYLSDLTPCFSELNRVLKPGGNLVFSLHHPFHDALEFSEGKKNRLRLSGPYFETFSYTWNMLGEVFTSYHHSLECISTALHNSGFYIRRILEPQPDQFSEKMNPDGFQKTSEFPHFITFSVFHR